MAPTKKKSVNTTPKRFLYSPSKVKLAFLKAISDGKYFLHNNTSNNVTY